MFCSGDCIDEDSSSHRCLSAEVVVDDSGERIRGTGNITRSQITATNTNSSDWHLQYVFTLQLKFRRNSWCLKTTENIYIYALSRCFTIEEQKQPVTLIIYNARFNRKLDQETSPRNAEVIKRLTEAEGKRDAHRASMTWQCRQVLWASLWSSRARRISPWTSSSGSTRLRFNQLSKPTGRIHIRKSFHSEMISTDLNYTTATGFVQIQNSMRSRFFFFFSPVYSI